MRLKELGKVKWAELVFLIMELKSENHEELAIQMLKVMVVFLGQVKEVVIVKVKELDKMILLVLPMLALLQFHTHLVRLNQLPPF